MICRLAPLFAAICVSIQPASATVERASQPFIELLAQQRVLIAAATNQEAIQKQKWTRSKHVAKPKRGQERWLNPQPEPPMGPPGLNPQPEPPLGPKPQPEPPIKGR